MRTISYLRPIMGRMVAKISIPLALSKLTAGYRAQVEAAAGNQTLSTRERRSLESSWAKGALPARNLSVEAAVGDFIEPKLEKALFAISSDKKSVTPSDVQKLYVTELRLNAEKLFPEDPKIAKLKQAIGAVHFSFNEDYNKGLAWEHVGGGTVAELMDEITGQEFDENEGWDRATGAKAVKAFAAELREIGASEREWVEEDEENAEAFGVTGEEVEQRFEAVARAVEKAFSPASKFKQIHALSHSIQEDGDIERRILLAQKKDGAWIALSWHDFPF